MVLWTRMCDKISNITHEFTQCYPCCGNNTCPHCMSMRYIPVHYISIQSYNTLLWHYASHYNVGNTWDTFINYTHCCFAIETNNKWQGKEFILHLPKHLTATFWYPIIEGFVCSYLMYFAEAFGHSIAILVLISYLVSIRGSHSLAYLYWTISYLFLCCFTLNKDTFYSYQYRNRLKLPEY